jgi:predicted DNA-binding transcriptional regulator YafY
MGRTERLYTIQRLLNNQQAIPLSRFLETLEVSKATFKRDLEYLRDRLGAPIVWDAEASGYRFDIKSNQQIHPLPGLWLNEGEVFALLTGIELLGAIEPAPLIGTQIKPIRERLEKILELGQYTTADIRQRIRLVTMGSRQTSSEFFQVIAHALLSRKRLKLKHFGRLDAKITEREVSPQRLVYYRDNWYLDAFCHLRDDIRSFAVDAIERADEIDKSAVSVDEEVLTTELDAGYGIFSGGTTKMAILKFSPFRARWVAREQWHKDQQGTLQADGSYLLEVPYFDDRELMHDILRQGSQVDVLGPEELKIRVKQELQTMLSKL